MGCGPSQALIYLFPGAQGIFIAFKFIRPGAVVVDAPVSASGQRVFSGEKALDLNRFCPRVLYLSPFFQDILFLMHHIMKRHLQRIIHVLQHDVQPFSLRPVFLHAVAEVPDPIRENELHGRFLIAHHAEGGTFLSFLIHSWMVALLPDHGFGVIILRPFDFLSPVKLHQNAVVILEKCIARVSGIQNKKSVLFNNNSHFLLPFPFMNVLQHRND